MFVRIPMKVLDILFVNLGNLFKFYFECYLLLKCFILRKQIMHLIMNLRKYNGRLIGYFQEHTTLVSGSCSTRFNKQLHKHRNQSAQVLPIRTCLTRFNKQLHKYLNQSAEVLPSRTDYTFSSEILHKIHNLMPIENIFTPTLL